MHPGLEPPTEEVDIEGIQETREEKVNIVLLLQLIHLLILLQITPELMFLFFVTLVKLVGGRGWQRGGTCKGFESACGGSVSNEATPV